MKQVKHGLGTWVWVQVDRNQRMVFDRPALTRCSFNIAEEKKNIGDRQWLATTCIKRVFHFKPENGCSEHSKP